MKLDPKQRSALASRRFSDIKIIAVDSSREFNNVYQLLKDGAQPNSVILKAISDQPSILNSVMMTKALQKEGITQVSICTEGFQDVIHPRYRHFCLEQECGKQLTPVTSVWPNAFPSEIIP